ncbi:hypothetical protein [Kingella bonacorsii]|uniref:Uncharacterized protein n=1 Tax=Kingella bonacorsii TaxID=2796361 RepID=A0ABS1BUR3_9NEIS|nr:hypothetical protein [Kingella bonacorsii]MBK0396914.1 hypothetical protein [Kingella bonacorsii]
MLSRYFHRRRQPENILLVHGLPASRRDAGQAFQAAQSFAPAFECRLFSGCLNAQAILLNV